MEEGPCCWRSCTAPASPWGGGCAHLAMLYCQWNKPSLEEILQKQPQECPKPSCKVFQGRWCINNTLQKLDLKPGMFLKAREQREAGLGLSLFHTTGKSGLYLPSWNQTSHLFLPSFCLRCILSH